MVTPYLTSVTINGTSLAGKLLKWDVADEPDSNPSQGILVCTRSLLDTILPNLREGMSVSITRGLITDADENVFDGEVTKFEEFNGLVTIGIVDELIKLMNAEVTKTYLAGGPQSGKGSEIFLDLINTFTDLTATSASVVDTGSVIILQKFICNHVSVWDMVMELCRVYNYIVYYEPDDGLVHFEPKGLVTNSTILETGVNIKNQLKWVSDSEQMINDFTALGAELLVEDELYFDGDASTTSFTLPYIPISVRVDVNAGAGFVLKTPGVEGSTGTYDYTVDREAPTIDFVAASTPPSGTDNIKVIIVRSLPVPLRASNSTSVDTYGRRRRSKHKLSLQDVTDGGKYAKAYVERNKDPFINTTILTSDEFNAGELVRVIDNEKGKDTTLYITRIEKSWPGRYDKLLCGDKIFKLTDWQVDNAERLKRLEELTTKNTDILVQLLTVSEKNVILHSRPVRITREDRTADSRYIVEHPDRGELGSGYTYGDGADSYPQEEIRVIWCEGRYNERFIDDNNLGEGTAYIDNGVLK